MEALDPFGGEPGKLRLAVHVSMAEGGIFDCGLCTLHYCDEDGSRTWIGRNGQEYRSKGPAPEPIWRFERAYKLGDHATCPKPRVPGNWSDLIALHSAWKLGTLYCSGGIADQPGPYVDAMTAIESERIAVETEKLKQQVGV